MQRTVETLVDFYAANTRVPNFRRLIHQEYRRYFQAETATSRSFERGTCRPLREMPFLNKDGGFHSSDRRAAEPTFTLTWDHEDITVRTLPGKLSLLCSYCVATGDYSPVFKAILREVHKGTLYYLYSIVFANIDHLRQRGQLAVLCRDIVERARVLRRTREEMARTAAESPAPDLPTLSRLVEFETNLLLGLALLAYLDREPLYDDLIRTLLQPYGDAAADDWKHRPLEYVAYYGEDRVMLTVSLLLYFSYPRFRAPTVAHGLRSELIETAQALSDSLSAVSGEELHALLSEALPDVDLMAIQGPRRKGDLVRSVHEHREEDSDGGYHASFDARWTRMRINLDLMLTELGRPELERKDEIVLFLAEELFPKETHNHIRSSLFNVRDLLVGFVDGSSSDEPVRDVVRVDFDDEQKARLDDAIFASSALQKIAASAQRLFGFAAASPDDIRRYTSDDRDDGFARDVTRLGDVLQHIRNDSVVSVESYSEFNRLRQGVIRDALEDDAPLRAAVERYYVPVFTRVVASLAWADKNVLAALGMAGTWAHVIEQLNGRDPRVHAIVDPMLLREALRNIAGNVRHNFLGWELAAGRSWSDLVETRSEVQRNDRGRVVGVVLRWLIGGVPYRASGDEWDDSTFAFHARALADYGGDLQITSSHSEHSATVVELRLVARQLTLPRDRTGGGEVIAHDEGAGVG